jgi:hypothetical protein
MHNEMILLRSTVRVEVGVTVRSCVVCQPPMMSSLCAQQGERCQVSNAPIAVFEGNRELSWKTSFGLSP